MSIFQKPGHPSTSTTKCPKQSLQGHLHPMEHPPCSRDDISLQPRLNFWQSQAESAL